MPLWSTLQRRCAKYVIGEARESFRDRVRFDVVQADINLAKVHFDLYTRYRRRTWLWHLAAWHLYRARFHAGNAFEIATSQGTIFKGENAEIMKKIYAEVPTWFKDQARAEKIMRLAHE